MADIAVRPNEINKNSIPFVTGSTTKIMRSLYGIENADKLIVLDAKVARAHALLNTIHTNALAATRDAIDAGIAKFSPEDFKTLGVTYRGHTTQATNNIAQLSESYEHLVKEDKQLKTELEKIHTGYKSETKPTDADIAKLQREITRFQKSMENYESTYSSVQRELERLLRAVSERTQGKEKGQAGPTPKFT